jgi:hypothetical protein
METKICSKCNVEKQTCEFGKMNKKLKSGTIWTSKYQCRECESATQRLRREREKVEDSNKYHQKWADYYAKTKEQNKLAQKNYLDVPENRNKRRAYIRSYKKDKRTNDITYKLFENHRNRIRATIKNKSNSSKELLGCEIYHYIKWIEFTMKDGMNWENHGTYWHIDHIIPINSYDIENPEEAKKAFNWKNTWALEAKVNLTKSATIIPEMITEHTELLNTFVKLNINN